MARRCFRTIVGLAVAGLALASRPAASPQTPAQPNRQRSEEANQRAAERIRALQREAESLATRESALLVELRKFEVQRQLKTEELAQIGRDRVTTERQLEESTKKAASLRDIAQAEQPEVEARLVRVYKMGQAGYWRLLLDVDDLRSVGRAYRTAAALTKIDRDRVRAHQHTLDALTRERKALEARAKEIQELEGRAKTARTAIEQAVAARTSLVESIDARRDLNAQLTGELEAAQQRLQASVSQLDAGSSSVALPLRPFQGTLPWPVRGRPLTSFGRSPSTAAGRSGAAGTASPAGAANNGIEIAVTEGQLVRTIHEGTVAYADQFTGYGNLVIVDHGDRAYSLYGHLSSMLVSKGSHVDAQSPVGMSGTNPSGNPALYFELRVDGKPVDPLQWLMRRPQE
jgi:murein hydrolase activator